MASPPSPHSPSTQHPAHALLSRAHSPTTTQRIFDERVSQRPLLLRPSSPEISARATRRKALAQKKALEKRRSALKPRPLSAAEKRKLGLYDIPKEQRVYKVYEGLHSLWLGYIREILGLKGSGSNGSGSGIQYITPNGAGPLLASADMHGALVRVTRSKCVSRVGLRGIVIRDSKSAFEIITKENQIKLIPKERTNFRIEIPLETQEGQPPKDPLIVEIIGDSFQNRAPDRANKKFKMHYQPYL